MVGTGGRALLHVQRLDRHVLELLVASKHGARVALQLVLELARLLLGVAHLRREMGEQWGGAAVPGRVGGGDDS